METEMVNPLADPEDSLRVRERDLVVALGERIVRLREAKGWSRTALARRLGVSRGRLGHWERGLSAPPIVIQIALSRQFGIPFGELVTGETSAEPRGSRQEEGERHLEALRRLLCETDESGGPAGEVPEERDWLPRMEDLWFLRPRDPNG
jgi:transcriptional regulator with XRE-family HTH domain